MKSLIKKNVDTLIILLVALIIGIPLFNSKLNVYYDDGIQHIARALGTLESIGENKLFPNIIFSFANNLLLSTYTTANSINSISTNTQPLIIKIPQLFPIRKSFITKNTPLTKHKIGALILMILI